MIKLNLMENGSEVVPYNFLHFPVHSKSYWLSYYPNMRAASHWHNDIEFIIILQGTLHYSINGQMVTLHEGDGLFINSKQLHYGYSADGKDCQFLCIVLPISLLYTNAFIQSSYIDSLCHRSSCPFLLLKPTIFWQEKVITALKALYTLCEQQPMGFELSVLSTFFSIWHELYQNSTIQPLKHETSINKPLEVLHSMIGYIQKNYPQKITLSDIAASGNVCRSNCCNIFSSILSMTPIAYLNQYRLEKSIELMHTTSLSITEIALQCGFNSSSYYTELFRKELGTTPTIYRKNKRKLT